MRTSRKIWGWVVFALGMLWTLGGLAGFLQGRWQMLLHLVLGIGLLRLGWNLSHGVPNEAP